MFLFILFPLILLLMHTKYFYHYNFVVKFLKPYLDAFQAPFKDTHRHYPGAELIIRSLLFAVGNNNIFGSYAPRIITNLICMLLLIYLCSFRPFKYVSNTILYASFVLNGQFVSILVIYTNKNVESSLYTLFFTMLIVIAFVEFGGIILYCLYINHLYKIKCFSNLATTVKNMIKLKYCKMRATSQNECIPLDNYEEYQDELLALDPTH